MRHYKIFSIFIAVLILLSVSACSIENKPATQVTASPTETKALNTEEPKASSTNSNTDKPDEVYLLQDQCILSYFVALKENNMDRILSLCASEDLSTNIKKTYGLDYISDLFKITSTTSLITNTKQFIYGLLSPYDSSTLHDDSEETIKKFIKAIDPANLNNIQVLMLGTPKEYPSSANYKIDTNYYSYRYCVFSYNGKTYNQGFLMQKVGNVYKLLSIGFVKTNYTDNNPFNGAPLRIEENEFKNLIITESLNIPSGVAAYDTSLYNDKESFLKNIKNTKQPEFKTSYEAVKYYAASVAKGELYSVLSSFAIKQRAENIDFIATAKELNSFSPRPSSEFPSEYEFYKDINISAMAATQSTSLFVSVMELLSDKMDDTSSFDLNKTLLFLKQNYSQISNLKLVKSDLIASSLTKSGKELCIKQAKRYGADNKEFRIIKYKFGKKTFIGGMELLSYGGNWSIFSDYTSLLPIPAYVPLMPSSEIDYDSYIKK